MFGSIWLNHDLESEFDIEESNCSQTIFVEQDDIVEIATRDKKPILCTSTVYDDLAHLRVLGKIKTDTHELYLLLVTNADVDKVLDTTCVNKKHLIDYNIENRFLNELAVDVSELHIRRVVAKQDGRFCKNCKEYNRHVHLPKDAEYICQSCIFNPYR